MKRILWSIFIVLSLAVGASAQTYQIQFGPVPQAVIYNGSANVITSVSNSATSRSVTLPFAPTAPNLILCAFTWADGSREAPSGPAGFTQIGLVNQATSGGASMALFGHVVQAGDTVGPYTFSISGAAGSIGVAVHCREWTNVNKANPYAAYGATASYAATTTLSTAALTAAITGAIPVAFFAYSYEGTSATTSSGFWSDNLGVLNTSGATNPIALFSQRKQVPNVDTVTSISASTTLSGTSGNFSSATQVVWLAPANSGGFSIVTSSPVVPASPNATATPTPTPPPATALQIAVLADNPIVYYPMNDPLRTTMQDLGPNNLSGVHGSGVGLLYPSIVPADGRLSVLYPSGANSVNSVSQTAPNALLQPQTAFTAELFVKFGSFPASGVTDIYSYGTYNSGSTTQAWTLQITSAGMLQDFVQVGTSASSGVSNVQLTTGVTYQFDLVYNGTQVLVYINGANDPSMTSNISGQVNYTGAGTNGLAIGASLGANTRQVLAANVADASYYATALFAPRICAHYIAAGFPTCALPSIATPTPSPSGQTAGVIKVWADYGFGQSGNYNDAYQVPASSMAKYFWGVYCNSSGVQCTAFKNAGGLWYGTYIDATYLYGYTYNGSTWTNGGRSSASFASGLGNSGFITRSNGSVVNNGRITPNMFNSATLSAWTHALNGTTGYPGAGGFNTSFHDDIVSDIGNFLNGGSTQITNDATLQADMQAILNAYPSNVNPWINALNSSASLTANIHAVLFPGTANILGAIWENCVQDGNNNNGDINNVVTDNYGNSAKNWSTQMNILLYVQSQGKYAMCFAGTANGTSIGQTGPRLYLAASMWLIFDPTYTVVFPAYNKTQTTDASAMPEFQIGIGIPIKHSNYPGTSIANLKFAVSGGYFYIREFTGCQLTPTTTGNCAAVVNATNTTLNMVTTGSGLVNSYGHAYQITSTNSLINSSPGAGAFSASIPSTVAGGTAVLLGP